MDSGNKDNVLGMIVEALPGKAAEAAALLGCSPGRIRRLVSGADRLSVPEFDRLCESAKCTVDELKSLLAGQFELPPPDELPIQWSRWRLLSSRGNRGISLRQLTARCGISLTRLDDLEAGRAVPTAAELRSLSAALDCPFVLPDEEVELLQASDCGDALPVLNESDLRHYRDGESLNDFAKAYAASGLEVPVPERWSYAFVVKLECPCPGLDWAGQAEVFIAAESRSSALFLVSCQGVLALRNRDFCLENPIDWMIPVAKVVFAARI